MKAKSIVRILQIFFVAAIFVSCSTNRLITLESGKEIDKKLIGIWKGCEEGQQFQNTTKCWKMERKADGTFILELNANFEGGEVTSLEPGSWWIENGKFHEFHENSQQTDTYDYTVLNKNEILFKSIKMSVAMAEESYEFVDYREGCKNEKELFNTRDGSSIEKAIKVKSISEEYEYLRNNCQGCKFVQQMLIFVKKKPYDILEVEKPDGSKASYYFDISSFYGRNY